MKKLAVSFFLLIFVVPRVVFAYLIYYPDNINGVVSVIDTNTNMVADTIGVGNDPIAVALSPNGQFLYVCDQADNTVSVIQTSNNMVVATITVGAEPIAVAVTPDGQFAYVCNLNSHNVSVIQTSNNMVVATITVGTEPCSVAITPNGLFAYVANFSSHTVSVINTSTHLVTTTITGFFSDTCQVAITPNGQFAYVVSGNLYVVATATNTIVDTIDVSSLTGAFPRGLAITPDGQFVYVICALTTTPGTAFVGVLQTSNNTFGPYSIPIGSILVSVTGSAQPQAIVISPDGNFAYACGGGLPFDGGSALDSILTIINTQLDKNQIVESTASGDGDFLPASLAIGAGSAPSPSPPAAVSNLSCSLFNPGQQKKNDFAFAYERVNLLQWAASPSQGIGGYNVYRNNALIATLSSSTLQYEDHNRKKGETTTYTIIPFSINGQLGAPFTIVVTP